MILVMFKLDRSLQVWQLGSRFMFVPDNLCQPFQFGDCLLLSVI